MHVRCIHTVYNNNNTCNNNNDDFILKGSSVGQVQSSLRSSAKTCASIYNYNTTLQECYIYMLGMGYVILLWHSLRLPFNYFRNNLYILLQNESSIPKMMSGPHLLPIQDILSEIIAVNLHF